MMKMFIALCTAVMCLLYINIAPAKADIEEDFEVFWKDFQENLQNDNTDNLAKMIWKKVIIYKGEANYSVEPKQAIIDGEDSYLFDFLENLIELNSNDFTRTTFGNGSYNISSDEDDDDSDELRNNPFREFNDNSVVYYVTWTYEDSNGDEFEVSFDFVEKNGKFYLFYISHI